MKKKLGIIGCGAMGRLIGAHVREHLHEYYELYAVASRTGEHASTLAEKLGTTVLPVHELIEACDMVVEAASASAMPALVRACLAAQTEIVCLSVGGFALDENLVTDVMEQTSLVHVPSGAVTGLDGICALREMGLQSLSLTTVKRPESLGLTDISTLPSAGVGGFSPEARIVFEGTAAKAIRLFPANVNIAIAVSLAGNGPQQTRMKLIADPQAPGTRHHISARAGNCSLNMTSEPSPLSENPRSSAMAMYSVPALLRRLATPLRLAG